MNHTHTQVEDGWKRIRTAHTDEEFNNIFNSEIQASLFTHSICV